LGIGISEVMKGNIVLGIDGDKDEGMGEEGE
jgi:hypothetical protein